ncbi:MAG: ABC transporter permease [Candidatus Latescibacteria bacterium]|nr:peptide ABC transporter permease [Gemmatimonadota bacterium]MDP7447518.1 ABC transporter permease [Candidatus Latescibacterota bacterium]HCV22991.1 peptide ABC transporter permease [Candidatus Latescibacterota bacterium]
MSVDVSDAQPSPGLQALRRLLLNRLALLGLILVGAVIFLALFAQWLAPHPYDFARFDRVLLMPLEHPDHLLGTDEVGRDYLSRLIYGARTSLIVSLLVQGLAVLIGVPVGAMAGYFGGRIGFVVSRLIDVMTAFPSLLFAILLISVLGGGLYSVVLALSVTGWILIARLTRAQFLALRERDFVLSAHALGVPTWRIAIRHVLPNALTPVVIAVSFGIPATIFAEAGLSFLGLGINDPLASWGKMVGVSNAYVRVYWHLALFPTLAIALTMLGCALLGDGLRDALDPRQRSRRVVSLPA